MSWKFTEYIESLEDENLRDIALAYVKRLKRGDGSLDQFEKFLSRISAKSDKWLVSTTELATLIGKTAKQINAYTTQHDELKSENDGLHDVGAWMRFLLKRHHALGKAERDLARIDELKRQQQVEKTKAITIQNMIAEGELVATDEVIAGNAARAHRIKNDLNHLPAKMKAFGKDVEVALKDEIKLILNRWSELDNLNANRRQSNKGK